MPIQVDVDEEAALVRAEVWGTFSLGEILEALDAAVEDPRFRTGFNVLSDHRRIDHVLSINQMHRTLAHLATLRTSLANARWAVVTGSAASYGMMRMMSVYAERIPIEIRPFDDIEEALDWVGRPEGIDLSGAPTPAG